MKKYLLNYMMSLGVFLIFILIQIKSVGQQLKLKDSFIEKFYIGTALNLNQIAGKDITSVRLIKENFNTIVAENCIKSGGLQPKEGIFNFTMADKFVDFGKKSQMFITVNTLVWHSQASSWFFNDSLDKDVLCKILIERQRKHITTVVGKHKGRIKGWDVVNEARAKFGEDFTHLQLNEIIPSTEKACRILTGMERRVMPELSWGGFQTLQITLSNLDKFSYIGGFSNAKIFNPETELKTVYNECSAILPFLIKSTCFFPGNWFGS